MTWGDEEFSMEPLKDDKIGRDYMVDICMCVGSMDSAQLQTLFHSQADNR